MKTFKEFREEVDDAKKKAGSPRSTSRGWEKAAKKNTNKKRRQAGKIKISGEIA